MLLVLLAAAKLIHLNWTKVVVQRREMILVKFIFYPWAAHFGQCSVECLHMLASGFMNVVIRTVYLTTLAFPLALT